MKGIITGDSVDSSQISAQYRGELLNCLNTMGEELQCVAPFSM